VQNGKKKKRKSQHKTNMDGEHKKNKKNKKMLYKNEWNGYTFFSGGDSIYNAIKKKKSNDKNDVSCWDFQCWKDHLV
jgi:hypothetical protein